jgi:AcrR family transcriptional regulator
MNIGTPKRVYRQSVRAAAAEATRERIIDAFANCFRGQWFDEIRLDDVAREAGVTIQTVLRRFGSKEGLINALHERLGDEIQQRRRVRPGEAGAAISVLIDDYEQVGDLVVRTLAQEDRYPAIHAITDVGRAAHRAWMADAFAPWLTPLAEDARTRALDGLIVASDVYVWKLLRKDMRRSISDYREQMEKLSAAALGVPRATLFPQPAHGGLK